MGSCEENTPAQHSCRFSLRFSQMKDIKKVLEGRIKDVLKLPIEVELRHTISSR